MVLENSYNSTKELVELIHLLISEGQSFSGALEHLKDKISNIEENITKMVRVEEDVRKLVKAVIDGNGIPSALTRLALIERELDNIKEDSSENTSNRLEDKQGKWLLYVALATGGLGFLSTILQYFLK